MAAGWVVGSRFVVLCFGPSFLRPDHLTPMASLFTSVLVLQQLAAAPVDVAAVAAASPRPAVCSPTRVASRVEVTLWDRARSPAQQRYCAQLARGYAALTGTPTRAIEAARQAEQAWPGRAAPLVLQARAEVALGQFAAAHRRFEQAVSLDASCLAGPVALHDRARAALAVGDLSVAGRTYRKLVPQVGLMPGGAGRRSALIEAAVVAMHGGVGGLDEALGYLGEARRQPRVAGAEAFLLGALALVLDRQGRTQEARGVAAEAGGPWGVLRRVSSLEDDQVVAPRASQSIPLLPRSEADAIVALLSEADYPDMAADYWRACLDAMGDGDPWHAHAARKLAAVSGTR
jgi:tetratricopeptide (TPR) repeat protein